ncbi:unnamed protein product, partial [Ectocarpus sp. 8 AP-2014]
LLGSAHIRLKWFCSVCIRIQLAPTRKKRQFGVEAQFLISSPPSSSIGRCMKCSVGFTAEVCLLVDFSCLNLLPKHWSICFLIAGTNSAFLCTWKREISSPSRLNDTAAKSTAPRFDLAQSPLVQPARTMGPPSTTVTAFA